MYFTENLNRASKNELKALIKSQRQKLQVDIESFRSSKKKISDIGSAALSDPLGALSHTLSENLSSKQRWQLLGFAFLAGGATIYLNKEQLTNQAAESKAPYLLSNFVQPLAVEFLEEVQSLGQQVIKNLFHANGNNRKRDGA